MLIKPIITEKSYRIAAGDKKSAKQFTFQVAKKLNSNEIKKLVEKIFDVQVTKVRTLNTPGKKIVFKRIIGEKKGYKKAILTLKPGQTIKAFEMEELKEKDKNQNKESN